MENKQTAVEWLIEELGEYFPHEIGGIHLMVNAAKTMEKEQIIQAIINNQNGLLRRKDILDAEKYYNEQYNK